MSVLACKVKWSKEISVDNVELDEQHSRLFEFTNSLLLHYDNKDNDSVVLEAINSLVDFSIYHFDFEEEVLKDRGYKDLDKHKIQHDNFRKKVALFKQNLENGEDDVMDKMIIYLIKWIKEHISVEDLEYKKHMSK